MAEALFMEPVLQEKIWGGTKLREIYGYNIPSETTGECWAISGHKDGVAVIRNGRFAGTPLSALFAEHPELFGDPQDAKEFPLLTKIIDATDDLSVQVHPDDLYGLEHAGEQGKTECWYIIDAEPGAEIVYGHHAQSRKDFEQLVDSGQWDALLRRIPVKPGDFFFVPAGTVHAIGSGITILETQQSSNTTYRLYDYDRKDPAGQLRPLHIQESLDVSQIPHTDPKLDMETQDVKGSRITTYIHSDYFSVYKWEVHGELRFHAMAPYVLVSVLDGPGKLMVDGATHTVQKGDHFILPNDVETWTLQGELTCIASTPGPKNS